ncbi:cobaltochelatase CobT-related protein [Pseudovibrio sp. SCP19]|uniref:cobaltochelatase CobT-related protein n=1 Tax=Pseudovibrio sp. SCP19 TaxID=3141374 RepID=UPI0033366D93
MLSFFKKVLGKKNNLSSGTNERTTSYRVFSKAADQVIDAVKLLKKIKSPNPKVATIDLAWEAYEAFENAYAPQLTQVTAEVIGVSDNLLKKYGEDGFSNISVSLLIDHSGSMKGEKTHIAACMMLAFSQLSLKLGIPFEVLGFTTREWKGKPIREEWLRAGKPRSPGRVCALRHIVYSSFEDQKKPDLSAMFLPSLFKENVDGEAIEWAASRSACLGKKRQLLLVVSDGAPVDDATLSINSLSYLYEHLKEVISEMQKENKIGLYGVGIQHSLKGLYPECRQVDRMSELSDQFVPFLDYVFQENLRLSDEVKTAQ